MQRVRIGLTGMAFVFLAVLIAAVFSSRSHDEAPITPNLIERQEAGLQPPAPAEGEEGAPKEPLAELGVAPGHADANAVAAEPPAEPARPKAPAPRE